MSQRRLAADRDAPDADDLPPHVIRIPLPLPLPDLQVVNVYAILGDDGLTLVDSGWADQPSETVLVEALDGLGFTPGDVRRIVVTHAHWDHYSRAIGWQRRYGTTHRLFIVYGAVEQLRNGGVNTAASTPGRHDQERSHSVVPRRMRCGA